MRQTFLFDINETVLDLSSLQTSFNRVFENENALPLWFSGLLHSSTVCFTTGVRTNFALLAGAMLDKIAVRFGKQLDETIRAEILAGFASLSAHQDIKPALTKLREHEFQLVAFSNSSKQLIATQIANAGLDRYFDAIISVEELGSFKPDAEVYRFAAHKLEQPLESLRLVATHDWDTHGAMSVGMKAAYIDRSGLPYNPFYLQPEIIAQDMNAIAAAIIEKSAS